MKKWITVLLVLLLALGLTAALAETDEWLNGWHTSRPSEDVILLENYFGNDRTDFVIPGTATVDDKKVKVQVKIFQGTFPANVTTIEIDGAHLIFDGGTEKGGHSAFAYDDTPALTKLVLKNVTWENLETLERFLMGNTKLTYVDISALKGIKPVSTKEMFQRCTDLETIDLSWLDTSEVEDMTGMFENCNFLKSVNLSGFNTSKVKWFFQMFYNCTRLPSVDVSGFKTGESESFAEMFFNCNALQSLNVSSFDTSKAKWMNGMFYANETLKTLDLSNFEMANVTDAANMLADCKGLEQITLGKGFRFVDGATDICRLPEIYPDRYGGYGPEWISKKENQSYYVDDIATKRSGIADTYIHKNPFTYTGTPSGFKAVKTTGGVKFTWNGVSGADWYFIFRADNPNKGNFDYLGETTGKVKNYTDTTMKEGKEYAYNVMAIFDFYGTAVESQSGESKTIRWMKLGDIKSLKGSNSAKKTMKLTWKKVTGATGYDVYYTTGKKAPKDSTKATATTKSPNLTVKKLTKGKTYYVYVRPFAKLGDKSVVYGSWSAGIKVKIDK